MDEIEVAQRRQQEDIDHALAARGQGKAGKAVCDECGAAISALRQELGAVLCIDCQQRSEQQARQWSKRG